MALSEHELMDAYQGLMTAFPADLHIARPMIQMLQANGNTEKARDLAMTMARRMLSLGHSSYAIAFISICEQLGHPDTDEIESIKTMAELTSSGELHSEEDSQVFELIQELSDAEAMSFLKQGELLRVLQGRVIVRQGEVSRNFYLILEGKMLVHVDTEDGQHIDLTELEKGKFFGEFACVYQLPRTATVTASTDATVLEFQDSAIAELLEHSPEAGDSLMEVVKRRMTSSISYAHPAFSMIEAADHTWLEEESELVEYLTDEQVSMDDDFFYILAYGQVEARRNVQGQIMTSDIDANAVYASSHKVIGLPLGTTLIAKERCLVCKVPMEIFNAFSMAYGGFEHWMRQYAEARNQKLQGSIAPPV